MNALSFLGLLAACSSASPDAPPLTRPVDPPLPPPTASRAPEPTPPAPTLPTQGDELLVACGRFGVRLPQGATVADDARCTDRGYDDMALPTWVGATGGSSITTVRIDRCLVRVEASDTGMPMGAPDTPEMPYGLRNLTPVTRISPHADDRTDATVYLGWRQIRAWSERVVWAGTATDTSVAIGFSADTFTPCADCDPSTCTSTIEGAAQLAAQTVRVAAPIDRDGGTVDVTVSSSGHHVTLTVPAGYYVRADGGVADQHETRYAVGPWPPRLEATHVFFTSFWGGGGRRGEAILRAELDGSERAFVADEAYGCASQARFPRGRNPFGVQWSVCPYGQDPDSLETPPPIAGPIDLPPELRVALSSAELHAPPAH